MSTDIERLIASLELRQNQFERAMQRAARTTRTRTRQIEQDFKRVNASGTAQLAMLARTAKSFAAGFFGAFTVDRALRGVRQAVADLSSLGKAARDSGMDVEDLQGLMRGFARETRVSEADVSAAFERFNRRIGEAVNGAGPLEATLQRLGISVRRSNGDMKTQAELLREVAEAIRRTRNEQERAAIAQVAFGDVGRRMAQALAGGSGAMDRMIAEAREAGDVIQNNLIHRAELLDDKFDALTRRVGNFFRTLAVTAVSGAVETPIDTLERLFGSLERARAVLGNDLLEHLISQTGELADETERAAAAMVQVFDGMDRTILRVATSMADITGQLSDLGMIDELLSFDAIVVQMEQLVSELRDGKIGAEEFEASLDAVIASALGALEQINAIDGVDVSGAVSAIDTLRGALERARDEARALREEMQDAAGGVARQVESFWETEEERFSLSRFAPGRSPRPRRAPTDPDFGLPPESRGGGGRGDRDEFARAVAAIRERTAALEAEAVAVVAAAASGREYGEAIMFAYERARLLQAAQRQGLAITPELEAQIDQLADAYVRAGQAAEDAAERMRRVQENAERGAQAMAELFGSMVRGGDEARQALGRLLLQIAQVQMQRAFLGLANSGAGGGFFSWLGGLLGFAAGGYTGQGGKHEPRGVVHGGEYVFSKEATDRLGVGNLEALHRRAKGYASGGYVGASVPRLAGERASANEARNVNINVNVDGANGDQHVISLVRQGVREGLTEYDRTVLPMSVRKISADKRLVSR